MMTLPPYTRFPHAGNIGGVLKIVGAAAIAGYGGPAHLAGEAINDF